ncbi:MAG: GNAT family N-acetyltransferase [Actinomycetota bacterium]|nr:GNAT family N-acetyltransferase [Actinomycetota bacterium]
MDSIFYREIKEFDWKLNERIAELEKKNMGSESSINQWVIPVIIRYGKFIAAVSGNGDSDIIGVCEIIRDWEKEKSAFIHSFYIDGEYRDRGIGKKLLDKVIDILRNENFRTVELTVDPDNKPAVHIYREAGFREIGFRKSEYGRGVDRSLMSLKLK